MSAEASVVICTHNRAEYLRKALVSLRGQTLDAQRFEIIVVDNASTDATQDVVEGELSETINLRYLHEPTLGLARARNTGWQQARGRYIAFLDDDAVATPDWLENALEFMSTTHPEPGMVGGRVDPIWEAPRPDWLADDLARALTIVDWPVAEPVILGDGRWVSAANIILPRDVLREIGGFQTDLGRQGGRLLSNEESLLRLQVEGMGRSCYYHPAIRVAHHAHATRLQQSWFKKRLHWQGVSEARMEQHQKAKSWLVRKLSGLRAFLKMFVSPRFLRALFCHTNDPEGFKKQCLAHYRIGYATGLLGLENWTPTK